MKILILNGSPRPQGKTAAMVAAYAEGAREAGHEVNIIDVCKLKIGGCLACEYCHTKGEGKCVQKDDMQEIYPLLEEAEMIVLASPVYYHSFTGQLQCAINRIYALDKPKNLKKAALILSSGSNHSCPGTAPYRPSQGLARQQCPVQSGLGKRPENHCPRRYTRRTRRHPVGPPGGSKMAA